MKCRKKKFDKIGAKIAVAAAIASPHSKRAEVRYYWCPYCKAYHLTKKEKAKA